MQPLLDAREPAVGPLVMSESILSVLLDARRARRQGLNAIAQRQRDRLSEMVAFARANSPYYHGLYEHLAQRVQDPAMLPVVGKQTSLLFRYNCSEV
jgi:phenylacetate-CoA ligase